MTGNTTDNITDNTTDNTTDDLANDTGDFAALESQGSATRRGGAW